MKVVPIKDALRMRGDPTLLIEVTTITPEAAAQWLKSNRNNRPVRRRHVEFLAREIISGNWQVNGQAIVISAEEEILDGQHRLLAIIEAGIPIKTLVVYGINRDAFKTIDTGAVRTGSDSLALWYPDANRSVVMAVGAAVPWCMRLEFGLYGKTSKISNTEVLAYVAAHPTLWRCAEVLAGYPKDARPLSMGAGTAAYELFQRKNLDMADAFMRAFYTGEHLAITAPEYILRQMLIRDAQRLTSYPAEIKMKMVVKAWNLRRRGRDDTTRQAVSLGPHDPDRIHIL